ncbi:MAG: hypothetical protein QM541_11015 [Flavobacterium sp.]|nr:hypothetical protein [Flavobacterium sp.]
MKALKLLIFSIVLTVISLSCGKETSFEIGGEYVSSGSLKKDDLTNSCLPSKVNGSFFVDSFLNTTNYLDITVDVKQPGSYNISTDTVNGYWFNLTGYFRTAGLNTVKVQGYGKPILPINSTFHINYGNSVCSIDIAAILTVVQQAAYTFDCNNSQVNGSYFAASATNSTNNITVPVNVSSTGAYTISTTVVNGISFSASGSFSATGNQVVTLLATGTPTAAGNYSYTITGLGISGTCSQSITCAAAVGASAYTFNCNSFKVNGSYSTSTNLNAGNTITASVDVTTIGSYTISSNAINGISFTTSGVFTTLGLQTVTLVGSGKPIASGSNNYSISGGGNTCSISILATGPVAAVFTFSGAPSTCTVANVNGTYTAGTALNSSNTVVVQVNVTTVGTYTIQTGVVNGIRFSASGTFTNTGTQNVTLLGSGTPTAAGTNTFQPQTNGCSFDVTTVPATVVTGTFTCKIDGVAMSFSDRAAASLVKPFIGTPELTITGYAGPIGSSVEEFLISIENNDNSSVKPGTYNEKNFIVFPGGYQIVINYRAINPDQSVTIWSTSSNIINTNPPFTIIVTSITATRVKGTFSGSITNAFQGSTKIRNITEGVFDVPIE